MPFLNSIASFCFLSYSSSSSQRGLIERKYLSIVASTEGRGSRGSEDWYEYNSGFLKVNSLMA